MPEPPRFLQNFHADASTAVTGRPLVATLLLRCPCVVWQTTCYLYQRFSLNFFPQYHPNQIWTRPRELHETCGAKARARRRGGWRMSQGIIGRKLAACVCLTNSATQKLTCRLLRKKKHVVRMERYVFWPPACRGRSRSPAPPDESILAVRTHA